MLDVDRGRIKLSIKELLKDDEVTEQLADVDEEQSFDDEAGDEQEVS